MIDLESPYNKAIRAQIDAEAEALRVQRWWDTYNAALGGMLAHSGCLAPLTFLEAHESATRAATQAHGELKP